MLSASVLLMSIGGLQKVNPCSSGLRWHRPEFLESKRRYYNPAAVVETSCYRLQHIGFLKRCYLHVFPLCRNLSAQRWKVNCSSLEPPTGIWLEGRRCPNNKVEYFYVWQPEWVERETDNFLLSVLLLMHFALWITYFTVMIAAIYRETDPSHIAEVFSCVSNEWKDSGGPR